MPCAYLTDGPLVVAVDSSTQSTKAIIVDGAGNVLAVAKRKIELLTPAMNRYEHDPRQWWQTTYETIGEALAALTPTQRQRVKAIGLTHQRESFAPFKADGTPIGNGILWLDGRAVDQIERYGSNQIHELSGKPAGVTPALYKLAWVKENQPHLLQNADKVCDVLCYLVFNLTGRWASSTAAADSLGLFNIRTRTWDTQLLQIAGLEPNQLPKLVEPANIIDYLRPELAQQWNLPAPIPVVAGLGDGQAAGIGAAAVEPDVAYLNMGTAVNAGLDTPTYAYAPAFRTHVSGIPGHYVMEVLQSSGSYLADWARNTFADPTNPNSNLTQDEQAAAQIEPGSEGLITLPYWNAVQSPYWDAKARGAIVGWRGIHTRAHMYRSILESVCFEMRRNLDHLEAANATPITSLRIMGGGTRSPLWRTLMADITGLPLTICLADEVSALGAGVLAMAAIEAHAPHTPTGPDVATSAKAMAQFGQTIKPNPQMHARYQPIAAVQSQLYQQLRQINANLDQLRTNQNA